MLTGATAAVWSGTPRSRSWRDAGGVEAAYKRRLAESDDPDALREELLAGFEAVRSPFRTAEAFDIEEIIDPRDTRAALCRWIRTVYPNLAHSLGPRRRGYRP